MEGKRTAIGFIGRASRWAAFLVIVLSFLSARQSWALIACHCRSHGNLAASLTQPVHDSEQLSETHHQACHHEASANESAGDSHDSRNDDEDISPCVPAPAAGNPKDRTLQSAASDVSCCCPSQASAPEVPIVSFSTQQPIPIEEAPAAFVSCRLVTAVSINIHGPPGPARSRPLYIVQSSLLI